MKIRKKLLQTAAILMGCLILGGCGEKVQDEPLFTERTPGEPADYSGSEFISLAQGDTMELLLNPDQATLRWQNMETGDYLDTRLMDAESGDTTLKSDVVASFFNGGTRNDSMYNTYDSMNSYQYGIETDGVAFEQLDNGVRIVYTLGSDTITYEFFPYRITDERINELVLQYLDDTQMQAFEMQYRQLTSDNSWVRRTSEDSPLAGMAANQLYDIFYNIGTYTFEELEADNTEWDRLDEMPEVQEIVLAMDYYLEGDDLVVYVNAGEIAYNEDYPLRTLDILPYFVSTQETDGYMFVPDGSGALIDLDSTKTREYQFTSRYWGGDVLQNAETYSSTTPYMSLPVFGMKTSDYAVFGIIEEGAEVATLNAYINGSYNNQPYSRLSLSFAIRESQNLGSFVSALVNYSQRKASTDTYKGEIKLRYSFLTGEDASYSGMAKTYQNYLVENGTFTAAEPEENAPIFLQLLGAVDVEKYLAGIPYDGIEALTTFDEAETILKELTDRGVKNMKIEYSGVANNGINQSGVEKVSIMSELGGRSGLQELAQYAESIGSEVYPEIKLQTTNLGKGLARANRSFFISGKTAEIYNFDPVEHMPYLTQQELEVFHTYIVSPVYLTTYLSNFTDSYNKLGLGKLASSDFMTFFSANYENNANFSISNAIPAYEESLSRIAAQNTLRLSNPSSLAYSQVDYLVDIPMENSGLRVLDASVPFTQMVLSGYKTYSTENLNQDSYDASTEVMKAIETGSALKFRLMADETSVLENTSLSNVFAAEYEMWKDLIGTYYQAYEEFYELVKGATLISHEYVDEERQLVYTEWSNGVTVKLNYGDESAVIEGTTVPAASYIVQ